MNIKKKIMTASGPNITKTPKGTNPADFGLAPREYEFNGSFGGVDNITRPLSRVQQETLAEHANMHVIRKTWDNPDDLFEHQELMAQRLIMGDSFLQSHKFALSNGPTPDR